MKSKIIVALLIILSHHLFAQDQIEHKAPTLQLGLDGIGLNKGDLDSQLILEIIAEKQKELKTKLIENMILGRVYNENGSGLVYNYTTNVLTALLTEPNPNIRTKVILENSVNAVFAYGFAQDFYVNSENDTTINKLLHAFKFDTLKKRTVLSAKQILGKSTTYVKKSGTVINTQEDSGKDNTLDNANALVALIIDISSEVLRNNETLKQMGLMRVSYSSTYEYANQYNKLNRDLNLESKKKSLDTEKVNLLKKVIESADSLRSEMEITLKSYMQYVGVVTYLAGEVNRLNLIKRIDVIDTSGASIKLNQSKYFEDIVLHLDNTIIRLEADSKNDTSLKKLVQETAKVRNYLNDLNGFEFKKGDLKKRYKDLGNIILTLDREILPILNELLVYDGGLLPCLDLVNNFIESLALLIDEKEDLIDKISESPFFTILSKVYDFDKETTYLDYIALLPDLENAFQDNNINYGVSLINSFIKDYTVIKKDAEDNSYMEVNVESFLMKMQQLQPSHISKWELLFTVGANSAIFNDLKLDDDTELKSYSYVSEKIGVKYKFTNAGSYKPRHAGESYSIGNTVYTKTGPPIEPLLSNIHWLAYGSGILYNIVNTGTTKDFNRPIYGTGLGFTFYNSLDLNISVGSIIGEWSPFVNVGFDIQFTEYISRLGRKRQDNKNQKLISNQIVEEKKVKFTGSEL